MKRIYWGMAMAVAVLISCTKIEVDDNPTEGNLNSSSLINFSASTGKTRATDNDLEQLKTTGFNIIAINKDDADIFTDPDDKYIWDGTLNSNAGGWKWQTESDDKRWPNDGYPITFYSHFPIIDAVTATAMTSAVTINDDVAQQVDMLAVKSEIANRPLSGMANLNFQHILSNIKFSILTKNGFKVVVQSIRVVKVAKAGRTYDYKAMTWTADALSAFDGAYAFLQNTATPTKITGSGDSPAPITPTNGSMILLPQQLAADKVWDPTKHKDVFNAWLQANQTGTMAEWIAHFETVGGARIEVTYRMEDGAGNSIVGWKNGDEYPDPSNPSNKITVDRDLFVRVGYPLDLQTIQWESGKRYTYVISLGTDGATNGTVLDPVFVDKDNPTDDSVNNPEVPPGGDITYNGHITFDVSVKEWDDIPSGIPVN